MLVKEIAWKILHRGLSLVTGIVLLSLLVIGVASTSVGFKTLLYLAKPLLASVGVFYEAEDITGNLYHFSLAKIQIQQPNFSLATQTLSIEWQPWMLLVGKWSITTLHINTPQIHFQTSTQTDASLNFWQSLPTLHISQLDVTHLTVNTPKHHIIAKELLGSLTLNSQQVTVPKLIVSGQNLQINLNHVAFSKYLDGPTTGNVYWNFSYLHNTHTLGQLHLSGSKKQYHLHGTVVLEKKQHMPLQLQLTAAGSTTKVHVTQFVVKQNKKEAAQLTAEFDWQQQLLWQLELKTHQLDLSGYIPALTEPMTATIFTSHRQSDDHFTATIHYGKILIDTAITGSAASDNTWHDIIHQLNIQYHKSLWTMKQPQTFTYHFDPLQLHFAPLCLTHENHHICVEWQYEQGTWQLSSHSSKIAISNFPITPKLYLNGQTKIDLDLSQQAHTGITGQGKVTLDNVTLSSQHQHFLDDPWLEPMVQIPQGTFIADLKDHCAKLNLQLPGTNIGNILGKATITRFDKPDATIKANLSLRLNNLIPLSNWSQKVYNLGGQIQASLGLSGALKAPIFTGDASWQDGTATLPDLGITIHDIELQGSFDKKQNFQLKGRAQSGQGQLTVSGNMTLHGLTTHLQLIGNDLQLLDLPSAHMSISPNLTYQQSQGHQQVTGSINVTQANLMGDFFQPSAASASPDVIFVNQNNEAINDSQPLPLYSTIQLMLGQNAQFNGFGIHTYVTGDLMLTTSSNQPPLAQGKLTLVNGQYSAYGKHFLISQGSLIYNNSPLNNPMLDISATYVLTPMGATNHLLNKLTVGIKLSGTLQDRKMTLFSDPAMSQEDILSYIVLGQPLDQVQESQQSILSEAALMFALKGGGNSVLNNIQETFGLNQLTLGSLDSGYTNVNGLPITGAASPNSSNEDNTAIFLGKSLGSKLFVSYGVGLFNKQQEVTASLKLSPSWVLKTTGSTFDSGIDLIYNIEHD